MSATLDRLVDLLRQREQAGVQTYGVPLDDAPLQNGRTWELNAVEELADAAMYLSRRIRDLEAIQERAAEVFGIYEGAALIVAGPEWRDNLHTAMGRLGYALAEHAAKHKPAQSEGSK